MNTIRSYGLAILPILSLITACTSDSESTVDNIAPADSNKIDGVTYIASKQVTLTGNINGSDIESIVVKLGGIEQIASITDGKFSVVLTAAEGENNYEVITTNDEGTQETHSGSFTVDSVAPELSNIVPVDQSYYASQTVTVSGQIAEDNLDSLVLNVGSQTVEVILNGDLFTANINVAEGSHEYTITAIDAAKNESAVTGNFHVDTTPPEITLSSNETNFTAHHAWWTFDGEISESVDSASLTMNDSSTATSITDIDENTGLFSVEGKLKAGQNTYTIIAMDSAGNSVEINGSIYQGYTTAAGGSHSGALKNGKLYTWGRNNAGQTGLGYNSEPDEEGLGTHPLSPLEVTSSSNQFISLSFNQNYSLAIDDDANVWSWGYNRYGELGRGSVDEDCSLTLSSSSTCSKSMAKIDITDVIMISAGYSHALALKGDGTVWAWGSNKDNELGNGDTESDSIMTPVEVNLSTSTGIGKVVQISAGSDFSAILDNKGQAWIWGKNNYGQAGLGEENTDDILYPTLVAMPEGVTIKSLATGKAHVLALAEDGDVYGWALNSSSQIGYYGYQHKETESAWERYIYQPVKVIEYDVSNPVTKVYANGNSSYIVKADKKIYPWGQYGSTSDEGDQNYTNLDFPEDRYTQVSNIKDLAAGALHIVATQENDTVFTFKWSFQGSLGGGETTVDRWFYNYPIKPVFPTE